MIIVTRKIVMSFLWDRVLLSIFETKAVYFLFMKRDVLEYFVYSLEDNSHAVKDFPLTET